MGPAYLGVEILDLVVGEGYNHGVQLLIHHLFRVEAPDTRPESICHRGQVRQLGMVLGHLGIKSRGQEVIPPAVLGHEEDHHEEDSDGEEEAEHAAQGEHDQFEEEAVPLAVGLEGFGVLADAVASVVDGLAGGHAAVSIKVGDFPEARRFLLG